MITIEWADICVILFPLITSSGKEHYQNDICNRKTNDPMEARHILYVKFNQRNILIEIKRKMHRFISAMSFCEN